MIASVLFDYIVIYGNLPLQGRSAVGHRSAAAVLVIEFYQYCDLGGNQQQYYGSAAYDAYYQRLSDDLAGIRQFILFFSDTENFVATNTTSVEGLVKEWDGDMHVTELQESTVLRNVPHFWELVPHKDSGGNEQLLPRTVNRLNGYLDCLYFSGVSILTIGYGDIVPESRFLKMLVLLEGFRAVY